MKNSLASIDSPQKALIFIPDISGFTRFVTDTEISHAKHIIEELLEILMAANKIGLEVSEIEGDAILFYRFGKAPDSTQLLNQVKQMFTDFHMHLKKYDTHRVCNCGACSTASNLALKFVAHYGDITINTIRQYKKLFGKDVIVAHRLLKNNIDSHEYSLFTENLLHADQTWQELNEYSWSSVEHAEQEYDSGKVGYAYMFLDPLKEQLPPLVTEDFSLKGMKAKILETGITINAPLEIVFNVVADIPWRAKWIPETLEEFTDMNSKLTQTGQTHKCLVNGPVIISHDYSVSENVITFTETDDKKTYCVVYELRKIDDLSTQLKASTFIKKNFFKEVMFKLFMKKKVESLYNQTWINLKKYCEDLMSSKKDHPYKIKIKQTTLETAM